MKKNKEVNIQMYKVNKFEAYFNIILYIFLFNSKILVMRCFFY